MKRKQPALYLARSPLVYALCQVRISAVMAIEKYLPDIQERLRKTGFPRFRRTLMQQVRFGLPTGPAASVAERYEFQDKDACWGVVLSPEFITLHTSRYSRYEEFEMKLYEVLDSVGSIAQPALTERVGLRYVDLVRTQEGESFADYLRPGLLGLDARSIGVTDSLNRCEFRGVTDMGRLLVRATQRRDGQILPPDLVPSNLNHNVSVPKGELCCVLDFDHAFERTVDFDTDTVIETAGELHSYLDEAFRMAVTPIALEKWGNTERMYHAGNS